jgi:hypothetical protein
MFRTLVLMVALRRTAKLAVGSQANAVTLGTAISSAVDPTAVITAAAGIITLVGAIVVTLKLGPTWAFKMIRKMVGAVR